MSENIVDVVKKHYWIKVKTLLKKRQFVAIGLGVGLFILIRLQGLYNKIYVIYIRMKCFLSNSKYPTLKINGILMKVDLEDKGLSRELILYKKREHFSTEFIKNFIKEDEFILEIGANKGYYALLEGKIAIKGKIYAIEPVKENYLLLEENIKLNSFNNITLFPALALSDKIGEKTMYFYAEHNWASFNQNLETKIIEERKISTLTLDEFVKRTNFYPSFLRMDVEGHEYEIIRGAINTIKKAKNLKLFIEIHPWLMSKEKINFILDVLQNNNFKIVRVFLEIEPIVYKFIKIHNYLNERLNILKYGRLKILNYEDLKYLLNSNLPNISFKCFFEKKT